MPEPTNQPVARTTPPDPWSVLLEVAGWIRAHFAAIDAKAQAEAARTKENPDA